MIDYPIDTELEIKVQGENVILEPPAIHGVRGFTIMLNGPSARRLAGRLISAATQLLPATTKTGQ